MARTSTKRGTMLLSGGLLSSYSYISTLAVDGSNSSMLVDTINRDLYEIWVGKLEQRCEVDTE